MTTRSSSTTPRKTAAAKPAAKKTAAKKTAATKPTRVRKTAAPAVEAQNVNVTPSTATTATEELVQSLHPESNNQPIDATPENDKVVAAGSGNLADSDTVTQILDALAQARPNTTGGPRVTRTHQALDRASKLVMTLGAEHASLTEKVAAKADLDLTKYHGALDTAFSHHRQVEELTADRDAQVSELSRLRARQTRADRVRQIWDTTSGQLGYLMDWHLKMVQPATEDEYGYPSYTFTEARRRVVGTFDGRECSLSLVRPDLRHLRPLVIHGLGVLGLPFGALYDLFGYFTVDVSKLSQDQIPEHLRTQFTEAPAKRRSSPSTVLAQAAMLRSVLVDEATSATLAALGGDSTGSDVLELAVDPRMLAEFFDGRRP